MIPTTPSSSHTCPMPYFSFMIPTTPSSSHTCEGTKHETRPEAFVSSLLFVISHTQVCSQHPILQPPQPMRHLRFQIFWVAKLSRSVLNSRRFFYTRRNEAHAVCLSVLPDYARSTLTLVNRPGQAHRVYFSSVREDILGAANGDHVTDLRRGPHLSSLTQNSRLLLYLRKL
jgi:hypothetical protein